MCTKWFSDGEVHSYFNPYGSAYEAFINYMNVLSDFLIRVDKQKIVKDHSARQTDDTAVVNKKITYAGDYSFDDLFNLPAESVKRLIKSVDSEIVAAAIKGLGRTKKEFVLRSLSLKKRNEIGNLSSGIDHKKVQEARDYISGQIPLFK
jgi:flagellar motor switch protein FliG